MNYCAAKFLVNICWATVTRYRNEVHIIISFAIEVKKYHYPVTKIGDGPISSISSYIIK